MQRKVLKEQEKRRVSKRLRFFCFSEYFEPFTASQQTLFSIIVSRFRSQLISAIIP